MITKTTKKKAFDRLLSIDKALIDITESQDLDEIISSTVNELGQILDVDRCFFAGVSFQEWLVQVEYLSNLNSKSILGNTGLFDANFPLVKQFIEESYLVINDLDNMLKNLKDLNLPDSSFTQYIIDFHKNLEIRSCVYMTVKINGHICGILGFHRQKNSDRRRHKWTQEEIELLKIVSAQISKAISESQLINDLKQSNEKLLELDKLKSQIISTVSHELKTPMANILGFSELLLHRDLPQEILKQYLAEIHGSSIKLSNLITDFLDLSRIEAKGELLLNNFEETELDWLAEKAWQEVSNHKSEHQIIWQIDENLPYISVDQDALNRVFTNLFSNAIKYSDNKSTITCNIRNNLNDITVSISDQGMGIPDDKVDSIFDRFVRVDNSDTREVGGTGLGLWITKQIIQAHNGQIWCESKLGQGSKFSFVLPKNIEIGDGNAQTNNAQIWLY